MISLDFNKIIENHLKREARPKQIGRYYPSEIGSCLRKLFYSYTDPVEVGMDTIKVFEVGNIMHHFISEVLRAEKTPGIKLLESELPFKLDKGEYVVSGRIDDLLLLEAEGKKLLVEVKSTAGLSFQTEASPHHITQLQLYMEALGVNDGAVLYVEKNTLQTKTFRVKFDAIVAGQAHSRFAQLHEHLKSGELPKPEARLVSSMGWMCKHCDYRERCWRDTGDDKIKSLKWP